MYLLDVQLFFYMVIRSVLYLSIGNYLLPALSIQRLIPEIPVPQ